MQFENLFKNDWFPLFRFKSFGIKHLFSKIRTVAANKTRIIEAFIPFIIFTIKFFHSTSPNIYFFLNSLLSIKVADSYSENTIFAVRSSFPPHRHIFCMTTQHRRSPKFLDLHISQFLNHNIP